MRADPAGLVGLFRSALTNRIRAFEGKTLKDYRDAPCSNAVVSVRFCGVPVIGP
jgi:hypothetical protein